MKKEQDLTIGRIPITLIKFSIPLFVANLLQSLYNIVDMAIVGRIVGSTGVAAISNASALVFIINALCIGITMGGTVLIAQYKGAGDRQGQKETIGVVYFLTMVLSLLVMTIGLMAYRALLAAMNVPAESMQQAAEYMSVILGGTFFVFGYNATCAVLRGLGDSVRPLVFVAIATVINIGLDYVFAGILGMGTVGAAYATVIAQGVSFVVSVVYLKKQAFVFDFKIKSFQIRRNKVLPVLRISLPTAVQMTVVNVSYLIIAVMLNKYGVTIAAAAGIGLKINTFAAMPCWAIGQAITTMAGQNMGAGLPERVEQIGRKGLRLNLLATLLTVIVIQVFAEQLIMFFDPANPEVISAGVRYLRICCFFNSLVYATMYSLDSFAVGIGAAGVAMFNALLDFALIRLTLCWFLSEVLSLGYEGIYWVQALSDIIPAIIGLLYFYSKRWQKKKLIDTKVVWKKQIP